MFFVIILQLFINLFINAMDYGHELYEKNYELTFTITYSLSIVLAFATVFLVVKTMQFIKNEKELELLKAEQHHNENLSVFLHELKHDLNNQIFIIDGMLQLGKVDEAASYAKQLNLQFEWMDSLLKLNHPELASLILNKLINAKNKEIEVEVNVQPLFIPKLNNEIYTRTLGNLLDNAIEALDDYKDGDKVLSLDIYTDEQGLHIQVANSGYIQPPVAERMFNKGFSTKGEDGHGLGLDIVRSLMNNIGGQVKFCNHQGKAIFELLFIETAKL